VEGETEELALQEYLTVLGVDCDAFGISIIEVKGKNQIPKYWRLYSAFQIPIIVIFDNDNSEVKQSSNKNIAACFGLEIEDIVNEVDGYKHIITTNELCETDILILEKDFETAVQNDLIKKGYDGLYQALENQAKELIKPLKNQQKGAIAREIARNIQDQIGDYVPDFVNHLAETISKKINLS
jgi:putative ATP-dependent endonuclease of OLD family